ncbi:YfdY family protein [Escherichia coli]|uniref:YfdY family protein n=1 Tax=Escherichia coli TaxID=562 RepID=UPI00200F275C|nr:YfdY family protein [Escherichia coli]
MINLWMFLALCIVCVSGYIGQVLNVVSAVSSFFGMVILAALIYYFTMWLTGGNELVTGIFMEGANKQVISSQADSLIKISRIWADFFPANTSNQPI